MRHRRTLASAAAVAAALALPASVGPSAFAGDGDHGDHGDHGEHHRVHDVAVGELKQLNDSGVRGFVRVIEKSDGVKVRLRVRGLETGDLPDGTPKLHMSHIHGFGKDGAEATCPRPGQIDALDLNDDGVLSVAEGAPKYGPVLVTLGHDEAHGKNGKLRFTRVFTMTDAKPDAVPPVAAMPISTLGDLDHYAVVVHGLTVPVLDDEGMVVKDDKGDVEMAYDPSTPVACAVLVDRGHDHHGDDQHHPGDDKHHDGHMDDAHMADGHMDDHAMH